MLWAAPASLGGCVGRVSPSSSSVLSPYQTKLKSPISFLLVTHRSCLGRDVPPGWGDCRAPSSPQVLSTGF